MSSDLNDKEALGHFVEAIGNASDAARLARFQPWMVTAVIDQLVHAREALRGLALLRMDDRWVQLSKLVQALSDQMGLNQMPRLGDPRWTALAELMIKVKSVAVKMYGQAESRKQFEPIVVYQGQAN